jgi:hypothetical protein
MLTDISQERSFELKEIYSQAIFDVVASNSQK